MTGWGRRAGPRAGPCTFLPPVFQRATPKQSGFWFAMLVSVLQFQVTPQPVPLGLFGTG